jgi:adenylate cyclase
MKFINILILPIVIVIVLRILFTLPFWETVEHHATDLFFLIRGNSKISDKVVIVEIGDNTFNSLDEQWPFPRNYYAHLIENLASAGAKVIVFDIEFTETSDPQLDEYLAMTAGKYQNVIFAGKLNVHRTANTITEQIIPPVRPIVQRGLDWGTVNIAADTDGFVRRYQLYQKKGEQKFYSIGTLAVSKYFGIDVHDFLESGQILQIGELLIPKATRSSSVINYAGPANTYKRIDFAAVLDDSTFTLPFLDLDEFYTIKEQKILEDKIVVIGVTGEEFHDNHSTPYLSVKKQLMPGVEIHANFIDMALRNDFLQPVNFLHFLIFYLLFAYIIYLINLKIKPSVSLFLMFIIVIANFSGGYYLFITQGLTVPILDIPVLVMVLYVFGLVSHYIKTSNERKFIKAAFGRYIAPELVEELIKDPKKLEYGGSQKEITVVFSDIRSFTPYTESHSPKEVVATLSEYLTAMVDVIIKNKGTLDKFVGDEIMALFGVPIPMDDHAYWACKASFEMKLRLNELQKKWKAEGKDIFEIGIGINSGFATVGNLGSEQIFDYTAIGDTVNAGARLEAINKNYVTKNNIILSEETYKMAEDKLIVKYLDDVLVKGKSKTIRIYELLGMKEEL